MIARRPIKDSNRVNDTPEDPLALKAVVYNPTVSFAPRLSRITRLSVVIYLCFAGWFFVLAPWTEFWSVVMVPNTPWWLMAIADNPTLRGVLAAFGALHFPVAAAWLVPREPAG